MQTLQRKDAPVSAAGTLAVFILLLAATLDNWGSFGWTGFLLMASALALCVWMHFGRDPFRALPVEPILWGLLIFSIVFGCYATAGQYQETVKSQIPAPNGDMVLTSRLAAPGMAMRILFGVALLAALARLAAARRWLRRTALVTLIVAAVAGRVLMLFSSPAPRIDVYVSQTMGARGLLGHYLVVTSASPGMGLRAGDILLSYGGVKLDSPEQLAQAERAVPVGEQAKLVTLRDGKVGTVTVRASGGTLQEDLGITVERSFQNVYSMRFPTPYPGQAAIEQYSYPPLTVYANALSLWLFHEVRGLWIVADLIGALCIFLLARRTVPGEKGLQTGTLAALVWLFLPRSLYVIEQSWTEPLCVALTGWLVLARGTWAKAAALGMWLSAKQYLALAAPLIFKLRRFSLREWLLAAFAGVLLLTPFLLWDWRAMYGDVLGFFLTSGARADALSLAGALKRFGVELPWVLVVPLWVAGIVFFTWRMKRTMGGWLFSTASLYLFFFMLGKQAFMNYFYLILFILLLATVAAQREAEPNGRGA